MRSLQLRHSQTPESAQMARAASALDLPLHANLGIMAQCRRRLLRQAHKSAPQTRSVADLEDAINHFVAETNADPKPFVWTARPNRILAAVKRGKEKLESIH